MGTYHSPEDWQEWTDWLSCGLHARNRWRLPVLMLGILFATGRRTVSTWLRAAGVSPDYQDYYYFLQSVGGQVGELAGAVGQLDFELLAHLSLPTVLPGGWLGGAMTDVRLADRRHFGRLNLDWLRAR